MVLLNWMDKTHMIAGEEDAMLVNLEDADVQVTGTLSSGEMLRDWGVETFASLMIVDKKRRRPNYSRR